MELRLAAAAYMPSPRFSVVIKRRGLIGGDGEARKVVCFAKERRGFGPEPTDKDKSTKTKTPKENMPVAPKLRVVYGGRKTGNQLAPEFASSIDQNPKNAALDSDFLKKVETVRRSALEQKKTVENKTYQAIDYDVPIEDERSTIGLGTKVGVGIAVVVFGLVFALGDFLPSGSVGPSDNTPTSDIKLTEQEKATLQSTLQQYEETLSKSPDDPTALEGAAVTLADLGEYERASSLLEKLIKERPNYMDAYRLLGEVKYELKDYDASVSAYKKSLSASDNLDFDVLRGLTNSLLASKKPNEAVQVLLSFRERLNDRNINGLDDSIDTGSNPDQKIQKIDPIQMELLLGKAYSDWGHVSDAVNVYDQLISKHPADFRGYLAKGIILKENGKVGDAERMFIQARFFAPEPGKALVDRYARR